MIDDNEDESFDVALFDTEDIVFSVPKSTSRNEIALVAKSKSPLNLVRYYLALQDYVSKIEKELEITHPGDGAEH